MLRAMAESADLQPWPRVGETWAPALPWPREECPAGFYTHGYNTESLLGSKGRDGYAWGIFGDPDFRMGILEPRPRERAVAEAWEYRYGTAAGGHAHYSPGNETSAHGKGRFGPELVTIEQVGGALVYARRYDGTRITLSARDIRRAFCRVVTVVEYFHDGIAPRETVVEVDQLAAYLAREDVLGDDSYAEESAEELLERGILTFEGDPPIAIKGRWSPPVDDDAVAQAHRAIDAATASAVPVEWPPGYLGQVIGTAGSSEVKFAFSVNDDLNPFTHPEQIGRMPPADRLHDTPEACVAAAWAHWVGV